MSLEELKHFNLVGGTALSLQYGHRISIDLDLFTTEKFSYRQTVDFLTAHFGSRFVYEEKESSVGVFCFIDSIKVDFVNYKFPQITETIVADNIRLYTDKDIAAMKIQAVLGRAKKKDFWDLAEILHYYSLADIMSFHKKKYPSQQLLISIPNAIIYFEEAEESEDPVCLKKRSWDDVKSIINQKASLYFH
jgi:predicted nucleotidyltransferase component of viral defense system